MLLLIEQLAIQGGFFFLQLGQTLSYSFTNKVYVPLENEVTPLWGYHSLSHEVYKEEQIIYAPSEMTLKQEQAFQSFLAPMAISIQEDCTNDVSIEYMENDMLTMDAWEEQPTPVAVTPRLSAKANTRIADHKNGEQLWVIEVIGEEQGYLHVSDGSARAWVDAVMFGSFDKGDILSILVERNEQNHALAKAINILQKVSNEFAIEEINSNEYENGFNVVIEQVSLVS